MPFQLDAQERHVRFEFSDDGVALIFRELTSDERDEFDKDWSKVVNAPAGTLKAKEAEERFARHKRAFLKAWAKHLLVEWEGIRLGKEEAKLTAEAKDAFFENPNTVRYWVVISRHFWPAAALKERDDEEPSFRPS